ncbi:MAG: flagellar biosynthesis anti-sigma factor FlgM [Planctomycetota bacterium]
MRDRLAPDDDLVMEQILENINSTPIGQVLKKIASLPEVRKEKVLNLRRQITRGEYDLNERLDVAVDKVLEQLTG